MDPITIYLHQAIAGFSIADEFIPEVKSLDICDQLTTQNQDHRHDPYPEYYDDKSGYRAIYQAVMGKILDIDNK